MRTAQCILSPYHEDLGLGDLRVVDHELGALVEQVAAHVDGRGLAGVAGVLLEREAEHRNVLARDRVEEVLDDVPAEAPLLVVVHRDDLAPVVGDLREVERAGEVY